VAYIQKTLLTIIRARDKNRHLHVLVPLKAICSATILLEVFVFEQMALLFAERRTRHVCHIVGLSADPVLMTSFISTVGGTHLALNFSAVTCG
jgi:hypothetical protein